MLPPLLADFCRAYPAIRLHVFSENTEQVAEGVASGRFGLGLIEAPPKRRDLKVQPWFDDEFLLVVPAAHEWASPGVISPEGLIGAPLVMFAEPRVSWFARESRMPSHEIRKDL